MNHQEPSQDAGNLQFRMQVWDIVRDIPVGSVTSYGAIARALGRPRNARLVGWAMHESPGDEDFPAHRVISSSGKLTAGWLFGHP
ncbi:MAG: MGMT family protein, partial [Thermomicrobiales bacterium]